MIKDQLDAILNDMPTEPKFIMCGPVTYAMIMAASKFEGHNWRRLKREINKAAKQARKALH